MTFLSAKPNDQLLWDDFGDPLKAYDEGEVQATLPRQPLPDGRPTART